MPTGCPHQQHPRSPPDSSPRLRDHAGTSSPGAGGASCCYLTCGATQVWHSPGFRSGATGQREEKAGGAQCCWLEWCVVAVRAVRRRPHAARAMIEQDFAFRGNSAGNKLRIFRDHGRAAVPRDNPDGTGTRGLARRRGAPRSTALRGPRRHSGRPRLPSYAAVGGPNHVASASCRPGGRASRPGDTAVGTNQQGSGSRDLAEFARQHHPQRASSGERHRACPVMAAPRNS
jgi:hypothetical protein